MVGHEQARTRLRDAVLKERLPQAILIEGQAGSGRQHLALWLAQLLFCEQRGKAAAPCGTCRGCRLVAELSHPDVHWMIPVPRPKAGDTDKQVEEVAAAIGEVVAERRATALYQPPDGMSIHGVASARWLQRRAAMKAVESGPKVFIIGDAERLVGQEGADFAANVLLKLLEEPPPGSYLILTAQEGAALLPTIRSRVVALRIGRLPDDDVRKFLKEHLGLSGAALEAKVRTAAGVIGRAVGSGDDKAVVAARAVMDAVASGRVAAAERLLKQPAWSARGEFTELVDALEIEIGQRTRDAAAGGADDEDLERLVAILGRIAETRNLAQGNVNPQLLLGVLLAELGRAGLGARREPVAR